MNDFSTWFVYITLALSTSGNIFQFFSQRSQVKALVEKTLADIRKSDAETSKLTVEATSMSFEHLRSQIEDMKVLANAATQRVEILEKYIEVISDELREVKENAILLTGTNKQEKPFIRNQKNGKDGIF